MGLAAEGEILDAHHRDHPLHKNDDGVHGVSVGFTSHYGVMQQRFGPHPVLGSAGETLLVHGSSSGIGVTAIQIARAMGNRVLATAGSDEKCAACVELGADKAINYRSQDFLAEVLAATGNKGVNVILDMVGGDYVPKELKCLAEEGRLVFIAFLRGPKTELDINEVMRRRLTLTGSTLRPRPVEFKGAVAASLREHVWPLIEAGKIKPVIFKTFPLAEAAEAHRLMESSQHIGKLVLTV